MMEIGLNVHGACRLCLDGDGRVSLFQEENGKCPITAKIIYDCVSVKITKEDKLPKGICENCLSNVESWRTFKNVCEKTQETLNSWLNCNGLNPEKEKFSSVKDLFCDNITPTSENSFLPPSDIPQDNAGGGGTSSSSSPVPVEGITEQESAMEVSSTEENKQSAVVSSTKEIEDCDMIFSDPKIINCSEIVGLESQRDPEGLVSSLDSALSNDVEKGESSGCSTNHTGMSTALPNSCDEPSCSEIEKTLSSIVQATVEAVKSIALLSSQSTNSISTNNINSSETVSESINPGKSESENSIESVNSSAKCLDIRLAQTSQDTGDSSPAVVSIDSQDTLKNNSSKETGNISAEDVALPDTTAVHVSKETQGTDSDKENNLPNSVTSITDGSKEQQIQVSEPVDHSVEGENNHSFPEIRIESISSLVAETTEFFNPQGGHDNSEGGTCGDTVNETAVAETNESSEPRPAEVTSEAGDNIPSSDQRNQTTNNLSSDQESVMEIDRTETNSEGPLEDHRSSPDDEAEHQFSQSVVHNIKQEPMDTHEVPPPAHNNSMFPIRIKTEFNTCEDVDYLTGEPMASGEETSKCDICNRKYSSVSNYLKHLQTKVHLYNASLDPAENSLRIANENAAAARNHYLADSNSKFNYSNESYSEDSMLSVYSGDSPMLRSRLEEFAQPSPNMPPSYNQIRQAKPKVPYPPSFSKLPKRKERCKLCNTSFTYISEMRRHLLSRKHKDNERLMRDNDYMMRENQRMIRDSERMFREKQRYLRERALMQAQNEEVSSSLPEKSQQFMCPIEDCHYSCDKGLRLLAHMKTHGIGQPPPAPPPLQISNEFDSMTPKPKLSLRQQELLKKELEKRKVKAEADAAMAESENYRCDGCSRTFLRESGLKKHTYYCAAMIAAQSQKQEEEEEEEEVDEEDDEEADEEETKMPENTLDSLEIRKMHCPICNLTFAAKSVFISHVQIYHKGSTLESGLFRPKKNIITSNKLRVKNKKGHSYVCNHCNKKFNLLSSLNYHLKVHANKHICKICKKGYDSRRAFMDHCRLHFLPPGSKQTLCHKCFRVFKTRGEFCLHRKNDMCAIKLKIYSCNFCEHSFKDLTALEEHKLRVHRDVLDEDENSEEDDNPTVDSVRQSMQSYLSMNRPNYETCNENRPGTSSRTLPTNVPIPSSNHQSAKTDPFLHCDVCDRDYASLASLKKHMWKYHQSKPLLTRRVDLSRNHSVLQTAIARCWKCKHCKKVCKTRRLLVVHLKKCKYNAFDQGHGTCLQCGKWFETGKARICSFCLPSVPKFKTEPSSYLLTPKVELSVVPKQEFNSAPARIPNQSLQGSAVKAKATPLSSGGIKLMKCPVGSKYFRSELLMIKHYSQCDGTCENRCSHCRKLFNSSKEYRTHLWNSKCFGHNRAKSSKPSLPLFNNHSESEHSELESFSLKPNDGSEVSGSGDVSAVESVVSEESSILDIEGGLANDPSSKIKEEKSIKMGRVCTLCDKVILMQRGLYRHIYSCFKLCMLNQESVSCKKCNRTFSKHLSMKENTTAIRQHILECYYIPYYDGQGLLEDGSPSEVPPPFLCYVCSFGFSDHDCLRRHILEHRNKKDEVNNIVLLLETEMLSERRVNSETVSYNIQIQPESCETLTSQPQRNRNVLSFKVPGMASASRKIVRKKFFECEKCSRKFTNRNKYLRHKKVHGIVTQSVFHEVSENYLDYIADHSAPSTDTVS